MWDSLVSPTSPQPIQKILLTNDLTTPVLSEALEAKVQLIISYHPPLFSSQKRFRPQAPKDYIFLKCVENQIALYSPHTSCDSVENGVNDWLAKPFGESESKPVQPYRQEVGTKVVCFVPVDSKEKVRLAMAQAGAGKIGGFGKLEMYEDCAFETEGKGHFTPLESSNPSTSLSIRFMIFIF